MQLNAHIRDASSAVYLILSGTLHCFILFLFSHFSYIYSNFVSFTNFCFDTMYLSDDCH